MPDSSNDDLDCTRAKQQLVLRETVDTEPEWEIAQEVKVLPDDVQRRLEVIQNLITYQGTNRYAQMQRQAAQKLGITVRSVQRLLKTWREQGLAGLSKKRRSDRLALKISLDWQKFIVKTYRSGNCGSKRMSRAQVAVRVRMRAQELGDENYPSRTTVYRILRPELEKRQQQKRSIGWQGDRLRLKTREGLEIPIEWSNQVWQCDHTRVDLLVVDAAGEILGRPTLSIVVDTYSRCIMGMHLGFDAPSAAVVCLALRHAILPKQYPVAYELQQLWDTYGLPQYLYTDGGKDFRSQHLTQVATQLGIVLCLRRQPSDGGIVERPFGTFNSEFFSSLPGYTGSNVQERSPDAESQACLTLLQLEKLLVRYIVDRYNQTIDARMGNQSRIGRWEAGRMAQLPLLGERELDICLMQRERRTVYLHGYIQFANLTYQGEHLAAYAGEKVIMRYNPRDITTIYIYQLQDSKEVFVTRAHAQGWETEILSYKEAQAIAQRRRKAAKALDNRSMLQEVRARDATTQKVQRQKKYNSGASGKLTSKTQTQINTNSQLSEPKEEISTVVAEIVNEALIEPNLEQVKLKKPVPYVRVYEDYEQIKR
ncbi:MAG: Mu transposase C-terminal domain-containing protein, partial [Chroococcidiopsis sp.]